MVCENSSIYLVLWCNGSTRDFGSLSIGSSPIKTTNLSNIHAVKYCIV